MHTIHWFQRIAALLISSLLLGAIVAIVPATSAAPFDGRRSNFADPAFARVWTTTDDARVRGGRSWYWGPGAWFDYAEFYRQGLNGLRTVQYFDKARMEINAAGSSEVTNGLLVVELVSGRIKLGNDPYDVDQYTPADIPVAGNPRVANPSTPGYGNFAGVATVDNGYRDPNRLGERISATMDRGGNISLRSELALPETELVQYNTITGHNIPRVFWDFMNLQGLVVRNERVERGAVVDWLFAMGLPITDPYWVRARVGDRDVDVLVQLFERRALTYVPSNPEGYKVEMGNVGQHYFQWRYPHLGQPWAATEPNPALLFASYGAERKAFWELYFQPSGTPVQLTNSTAETVPFSYRRSWDLGQTRVLGDSRRSDGKTRQVFEFNFGQLYGTSGSSLRRLSYTDGISFPPDGYYNGLPAGSSANEYNAAYSPDGTKIAFISDRNNGLPQLFLMTSEGSSPVQLLTRPYSGEPDTCDYQYPSWSPDGRMLYWESRCDGDYEIYRAELAYLSDGRLYTFAWLANVRKLTDNTSDDRFPRISPDGRRIAFSAYRDGTAQLYLMNADGSNQTRLLTSSAQDEAPTWSPDGGKLAFTSNRDGDYEIFIVNVDGSNLSQFTSNGWDDRWPLWAQ